MFDDYDDGGQDDLNSYSSMSAGGDGGEYEDLSGFSVDDASGQDEGGMGADWLADNDPESPDPSIGMATQETLFLGRLEPLSDIVKEGFHSALTGRLPAAYGFSDSDILANVKVFEANSEVSAQTFADKMTIVEQAPITHLTRQGKDLPYNKEIKPKLSRSDYAVVMSMMGKTSGSYLTEGPGSKLAGNNVDNHKRKVDSENDLDKAYGYISELAQLYIRDETKGTREHKNRSYMVEEALTDRFMKMQFWSPNEYGPDKGMLPVPNDVWLGNKRITGLRPTVSHMGTSTEHTKITASYQTDLDDKELAAISPNLRKSLFPSPTGDDKLISDAEKAVYRKDTQEQLDEYYEKAEHIRVTFKKAFPTHRDESLQQGRHPAFDRPYGDQSERSNLVNEAILMGLDQNAPDLAKLTKAQIDAHGKGSESGGMYGATGMSEVGEFLEYSMLSKEASFTYDKYSWQAGYDPEDASDTVFPDTDRGRYQRWVHENNPASQGSEAWKAERVGLITASTAKDLRIGNGKIAAALAAEKLGIKDDFTGNSWTKDGNTAEAGVIASFRGTEGKGLTVEEAYFEPSKVEGLEGIVGVSPDARVYKADGTSDGLLEVKYLTNKAMKGAETKYREQLQMQMLSTGEKQVHFYRKSSDDGHYEYDLVEADTEMQAKLKKAAIRAHNQAANIDQRGMDVMREKINLDRAAAKASPSSTLAGPEAEFKVQAEKVYKASAFDPMGVGAPAPTKPVTNADIVRAVAAQTKEQNAAIDASVEANPGNSIESEGLSNVDEAAQRASDRLDKFSSGLQTAVKDLAKLGGLMQEGNDSGMSEVQLAARTGLDVKAVRRTRESLVENGLSEAGATSTIAAAGTMQAKFGDAKTTAAEYTRLVTAVGTSSLEGVKNLEIPSIGSLQSMNPQELIEMAEDMMQGKTMEERSAIGRIMNMQELAVSDGMSDVIGMDGVINEEGLRGHQRGAQRMLQAKRDVMETGGSFFGEMGGTLAAGATVLGGVVGGLVGAKSLSKLKNMKMPSKEKMKTGAKGLGKFAKLSPLGIAPLIGRAITDTGDDGSVADSLFDVAEFAGTFAMAGGLMGGPAGAVAGAVVGTGIGALNEFNEYLTDRNNSPSTEIGKIADPTQKGTTVDVTNNTEVTVTVDRDLIRTEVNNNGDLDTDEEATFSTAG